MSTSAGHEIPKANRCDNGPELISKVMDDFCEDMGIAIRYIQPGKPNQNGLIERFNRTYREEVLNCLLDRKAYGHYLQR